MLYGVSAASSAGAHQPKKESTILTRLGAIRLAAEISTRHPAGASDRGLISGLVPRSDVLPARAGQDAGMALTTGFTELFGIRHPIALAPMGGSAGGALTAAVSHGGGLGLLGSGDGERSGWLARWRSSPPAPTSRGAPVS
jgi:hypothetical protein